MEGLNGAQVGDLLERAEAIVGCAVDYKVSATLTLGMAAVQAPESVVHLSKLRKAQLADKQIYVAFSKFVRALHELDQAEACLGISSAGPSLLSVSSLTASPSTASSLRGTPNRDDRIQAAFAPPDPRCSTTDRRQGNAYIGDVQLPPHARSANSNPPKRKKRIAIHDIMAVGDSTGSVDLATAAPVLNNTNIFAARSLIAPATDSLQRWSSYLPTCPKPLNAFKTLFIWLWHGIAWCMLLIIFYIIAAVAYGLLYLALNPQALIIFIVDILMLVPNYAKYCANALWEQLLAELRGQPRNILATSTTTTATLAMLTPSPVPRPSATVCPADVAQPANFVAGPPGPPFEAPLLDPLTAGLLGTMIGWIGFGTCQRPIVAGVWV